MYVGVPTDPPPPPPGSLAADRPTRRLPRFGSTKGGEAPPIQPPKRLHTPQGHTLAGGGPRGMCARTCVVCVYVCAPVTTFLAPFLFRGSSMCVRLCVRAPARVGAFIACLRGPTSQHRSACAPSVLQPRAPQCPPQEFRLHALLKHPSP